VAASSFRRPEEIAVERTAVATPVQQEPIAATAEHDDPVVPEPSTTPSPRLTITFARSSSPTFPLVRRRLDSLAPLGSLTVTKDDKGREACLELTVQRGLVENARRIASLIAIVQRWKTSETDPTDHVRRYVQSGRAGGCGRPGRTGFSDRNYPLRFA
jgi:hypothetical protein